MRKTTRLDHEARIEEAARFLVTELDDTPEPSALADRVAMSRFHFHRVFQTLLGETVGDMSRRLRLERAAHQLRTGSEAITCIALDAGYATHEAFIRAFRQAFGATPSVFRTELQYDGLMPTPNGLHFNDPNLDKLKFAPQRGECQMNIEVKELPARRALCMTHSGPYYMIGQTFGRLGQWCQEHKLEHGMGVALYYDDPKSVSPEQLRSDAGVFVEGDPPIESSDVHWVDMPAGQYAVYTHVGHYEGLNAAWDGFIEAVCGRQTLASSGYELGAAAPFEVYVDDCSVVPPDKLRTELYVSLVRTSVGAPA